MKTTTRLFALAGFLVLGTASASAVSIGTVPYAQQRLVTGPYQDAYDRGFRETVENKCIDGNNFQSRYVLYEQRAQDNYTYSIGTPDEDYYRGYLDGLHEGYNQPAYCGPTGGGSPGGGNPPCSTCGPGPFIPE